MSHPHQLYLKYLLTQRREPYEIVKQCEKVGLPEPSEDDVLALQDDLGELPACWERQLGLTNVAFSRWLRDRGLLDLWRGTPAVRGALQILASVHLRRSVEGLLLLNPDETQCLAPLLGKFRRSEVPTAPMIAAYRDIFWDFTQIPAGQAISYVGERYKKLYITRPEVFYGLVREDRTVYSALGLKAPRVDDLEILERAVAYVDQRIAQSERDPDGMNEKLKAEVAVLSGKLPSLLQAREAARQKSGTSAADQVRMRLATRQIPAIPSIESIQERSATTEALDVRASGE